MSKKFVVIFRIVTVTLMAVSLFGCSLKSPVAKPVTGRWESGSNSGSSNDSWSNSDSGGWDSFLKLPNLLIPFPSEQFLAQTPTFQCSGNNKLPEVTVYLPSLDNQNWDEIVRPDGSKEVFGFEGGAGGAVLNAAGGSELVPTSGVYLLRHWNSINTSGVNGTLVYEIRFTEPTCK